MAWSKSVLKWIETYKDTIEVISIAFAVIFGSIQIIDISGNISAGPKLETYKFVDKIVNETYPNLTKYRRALAGSGADLEESDLPLAMDIADALDDIDTCISVGACDKDVARRYLCNSNKMSNILSAMSGMMQSYSALMPVLAISPEMSGHPRTIEMMKKFYFYNKAYHFASSILSDSTRVKAISIFTSCLSYRDHELTNEEIEKIKNDDKELNAQINQLNTAIVDLTVALQEARKSKNAQENKKNEKSDR
jgi:outer membrane murein-binding lipoprotein Lpp